MVKKLNSKSRDILRYIYKSGGSVTPHKISKDTGIAYATVKKYLKQLEKEKLILPIYYHIRTKRIKSAEGDHRAGMRAKKIGGERKKRGEALRYTVNYDLIFSKKKK